MSDYSIDDDYTRYLAADEQMSKTEYEAHIQADAVQEELQPKRRRFSEPPLKKPSLLKKPKPATKISCQTWLKYRAGLAKMEALLESVTSSCYDHISKDIICIARDCKDRAILAVFPRGFEFVYSPEAERRCMNALANNIEKYTESQPPTVLDCRHAHYE
ncbi:MAG: hypothetical protein M1813_000736 [Trichoglossum hirsutum]|nr:MAG: hypothetical protein M1813_000736 [Trichoglossum hirsutum]